MIAGTCYNGLTEAECLAVSGTYGGDGTSCEEVPDLGACWVNGVCLGDGMTEAACLAQGGSWRGSSAVCGDPPPPDDPVTGACCEVSGVCTDGVTEAACTGAGGTWQGANTTCVQLQWVLAAVVTVADVSQASSVAAGSHVAGRYFVRYKQGAYRYADVAWSAHGIYLEFGGGNTNWICGVPTVQSSAAAVQTYYNSLAVRPTEYFNHSGGNMTLKFGDSYYGDNLLGTNPPQFEIWREDTVAIDCCDVAVTQADEALVSPNGHSVTSTIAAAVITGGAAPLTTVYEALYNNSVMRVVADPSVTARVWQMGVTQMRVTVTDANGCTAVDYFTVTVTSGGSGICPDDCRGSDPVTITWGPIFTNNIPPYQWDFSGTINWLDDGIGPPWGGWSGRIAVAVDGGPPYADAIEALISCADGEWTLLLRSVDTTGEMTATLTAVGSSCDPAGTYGNQAGAGAYSDLDFSSATVTVT